MKVRLRFLRFKVRTSELAAPRVAGLRRIWPVGAVTSLVT
jgi:hypothetical protein